MSLEKEIARVRAEVKTEQYSMSIGELSSIYERHELELHPQFQRFFRWTDEQKCNLIESILLGIPLPPIYVSQRKAGDWDVIDGLQRLSAIFQFMGILRDRDDKVRSRLVLQGTKYLPSLQGKMWPLAKDGVARGGSGFVSSEVQLLVRRAKLDVKIVLRESSRTSKYELFWRLNTGGSLASDQEVRNCVLIMENDRFFDWYDSLAKNFDFLQVISLSDRASDEQYALELVTRFLVLRRLAPSDLKNIDDLKTFLDDKIVGMAADKSMDLAAEAEAFSRTFAALNASLGEDVFRRYDKASKRFMGRFLISAFEAVAVGVGHHADRPFPSRFSPEIARRVMKLWSTASFNSGIGSGVAAADRLRVTVPLGRKLFDPTLP